ncbi:MAG TPA: hypothetical protein PKX41_13215 [Anaerolineaceae bacterium]|jgi:hypothetical protein|nr:hypothetical protein [Anaerolineaceae bacterium]
MDEPLEITGRKIFVGPPSVGTGAACTFPATSNKIRETVTNKPCFTNRYILSSSELRVGSNAIFKNVAVVFECPEDGSTAYCVVVYNNHVVVHAAYLIQCSVYF